MESHTLNLNIRNSFIQIVTIFVLLFSQTAVAGGSIMDFLVDDDPKENFLPPDVAFKLDLVAQAPLTVIARFNVEPGYYLYKSRIKFESPNATIASVDLPVGEMKEDPNFGAQEVYHHNLTATIHLANRDALETIQIKAKYQGCSESGLCYAPIKKTIDVLLPANLVTNEVASTVVQAASGQPAAEQNSPASILATGNLWLVIAGFFVAGLLLSLTPCVLPMIPILSSIIVGSQQQQENPSKLHAFLLSVAYVLGMALSYTLAGIAAGLSGSLISQSLQNAWVLGATAIVFVLLSLSMFGFYELKLPASIESKMLSTSNKLKGGQFFGVFVMGALSALIVSPCVAAPLAGALLYIGQTNNVLLGGVGLFALALGMGVPLLLIGASAGQVLPKAGNWMTAVRNFFGVLMLGMAIWIISPVIPGFLALGLWAALAIVTAVNLYALDALPLGYQGFQRFWKGIGILLLVYGVALMVGALSGGQSVFQPLGHLLNGNSSQAATNANHLAFTKVKSVAELNQQIENAAGKPVMLDFYADWCVSCKEMEALTFSDINVQSMLRDTVVLQADVTENNADDQALLKHFNLYGPPGIIFFDDKGKKMQSVAVIGFQNADKFSATLAKRNACLSGNTKRLTAC